MLTDIPEGWGVIRKGKAIQKEFVFRDFENAFAFMVRAKSMIDQLNHHPEWSNVYNRVSVTLTTHDVGGLSDLDCQLADAMDTLAST